MSLTVFLDTPFSHCRAQLSLSHVTWYRSDVPIAVPAHGENAPNPDLILGPAVRQPLVVEVRGVAPHPVTGHLLVGEMRIFQLQAQNLHILLLGQLEVLQRLGMTTMAVSCGFESARVGLLQVWRFVVRGKLKSTPSFVSESRGRKKAEHSPIRPAISKK